jgi:hypothetical protein
VHDQPIEKFDLILKKPDTHLPGFSVRIKHFGVHKKQLDHSVAHSVIRRKENQLKRIFWFILFDAGRTQVVLIGTRRLVSGVDKSGKY